ncbi:MerC mercury resistance protein [Idiomarina loihiensis]|uniref:MerC domain-containing protein n=1 Tax=Idiomarina TaxID=135575 RepID=UPI000D712E82|nr:MULTISPECIES: MerC domain-containing protein [Idiomarina]PWW40214.1 MerC mercury resistance protein [Idiomarina loihiensis]TDP49905.1 MerC mercury resistance protein [Idiomarina loihiensis]TDS24743.1 MerC mercury resistance protein [Idiomarina sp. H2]
MSDRLGMFFSGLCFVHCLATPILLIFLGTNSLASVLETPLFHRLLLLPVLTMAIFQGYYAWKNPQAKLSRVLLPLGCLAVVIAQFFHDPIEILLTIIGSLTLISGHFFHLKHEHCAGQD